MTRRVLLLGCWAALLVAPAVAAPPPSPKARSLRLEFTCEVKEIPAGAHTIEMWIPVPPSDERQTVTLLNADALTEGRFTRDKTFDNELYYRRFDVSGESGPWGVELDYDVLVREATVDAAKQLISTHPGAPADRFAAYLRSENQIPLDGRIAELAAGISLPAGEPLRAGRAIYDYLVDTMTYNYLAPGAGKGNAVWACDSKTGDCTDFHSVFIGVCRWRGIPADHVFGLPLPPEKPQGVANHCHCWAQFWVDQVGWIPIDASRADKFPQDRDYYFGTLGSTWVTLAHGRGVVLEPPQHGPPLNMLHGPVVEIDGQPLEKLRWSVHYEDRSEPASP